MAMLHKKACYARQLLGDILRRNSSSHFQEIAERFQKISLPTTSP
jgi:hypothetical protein